VYGTAMGVFAGALALTIARKSACSHTCRDLALVCKPSVVGLSL
jgi:hypothetical protein